MKNKKKGNKSLKRTHTSEGTDIWWVDSSHMEKLSFSFIICLRLSSERNNPCVSLYDIRKYFLLYALCFVKVQMLFVKKRIPRVKSFFSPQTEFKITLGTLSLTLSVCQSDTICSWPLQPKCTFQLLSRRKDGTNTCVFTKWH